MNHLARLEPPPKRRRAAQLKAGATQEKDGNPKQHNSRSALELKSMVGAAEAHRRLQIERGTTDVRAGRIETCACCTNAYASCILTGSNAGGEPICEHCIREEIGGAPPW